MLTAFDSMKRNRTKLQSRKILFQRNRQSAGRYYRKQNLIATNRAQINGVENLSSFIERREVVETEIKTFNEGVSNTKQEIENCKGNIGKV